VGKGLIDGSSVEGDFGKDVFYSPYTPTRIWMSRERKWMAVM
jgi:hypothetical protein